MRATFVEASHGRKLIKTIGVKETTAYPNVVQVTSHEYEVPVSLDGLRQKHDLLQKHSALGHCLLKGNFVRPLVSESRAGATDKEEVTSSMILDLDNLELDGVTIPKSLDQVKLILLTERFIELLPLVFKDTSYIVQASSSMGLKSGINVHIEFFLKQPVSPRFLKSFLTRMNFEVSQLESNLSLSATGTALKYTLDPSVADNSKLIYIAPPAFDGVSDPFASISQRIALVEKGQDLLDISGLYPDLSLEQIEEAKRKKSVACVSRQVYQPRQPKHRMCA